MGKKYLSLEEASRMLGMDPKELSDLRENGKIRGFADRGTWKFREDEVEELSRNRQADSGSHQDMTSAVYFDDQPASSSEEINVIGEQPTIIRKGRDTDSSDSDVRLVFDDDLLGGSSAEVPSTGHANLANSDVLKLEESGSEIRLSSSGIDRPEKGSDSDVKLVGPKSAKIQSGSTNEANLVGEEDLAIESGSSVLSGNDAAGSSVLMGDDEGIALDDGDSGISLLSPADSGIALEGTPKKKQNVQSTMPMIPSVQADDDFGLTDTGMEIPTLDKKQDSEFEFSTNVLDEDSSGSMEIDEDTREISTRKKASEPVLDSVFEEDEASDVEDVVEDDVFGEDDAIDDDVFGAADADFDEGLQGGQSDFAIPARAPVEVEWGTGMFIGVLFSTIVVGLTGWVMFDLTYSMWGSQQPSQPTAMLLDIFASPFLK